MKLDQCAVFASAMLFACSSEEAPDAAPSEQEIEVTWAPLDANERYEGKSLAEWLVEWKRWTFAQTSCDAPVYDPDGSLCDLYQDADAPVFFLDQSTDDAHRTKCRIPKGKAIVVPIAVVSQENIGEEEPLSDADMREIVTDSFESMRDLEIAADDRSFKDQLADYAIAPLRFDFDLPAAPNWFSCNGFGDIDKLEDQQSWLAGYLMVFPPPPPGSHKLRYAGVQTYLEDEYYLGATTSFVVE